MIIEKGGKELRSLINGYHTYLVLCESGQWNELFPFLFKCSKSAEADQREAALIIFSTLATWVGDKFRPYFSVLREVLSAGLADTEVKVRKRSSDDLRSNLFNRFVLLH